MIELLIALAVLGLLAAVALPSYQSQIRKTRRADALAGILAVQQAQERLRARQPDYAASLGGGGGLGLAERSPAGHYLLSTQAASGAEGLAYEVRAEATGPQSADTPCRHFLLQVEGGRSTQRSGADLDVSNPPNANRSCWGL